MASIMLRSVSLEFPVYHIDARSIKNKFLRMSTGGRLLKNAQNAAVIKALDNVSFQLEHGDRLGLIGHNGAGKSSLLRVLSQIYEPTQGFLKIEGKVTTLLDIMLGIECESTGYENILMRGILLGYDRKTIKNKIPEIAEFSGLGDFLSMPIRTYSSGMQLRLAFAVATSIAPEILLLDEVVGTGDADFFAKAKKRMLDLISESSIVVLATHSLEIIQDLCNKVLWLDAGKIRYFGDMEEGLKLYHENIAVTPSAL